MGPMVVLALILGLAAGVALAYLVLRERTVHLARSLAGAEQASFESSRRLSELEPDLARLQTQLEHERAAWAEKQALLERQQSELSDTFKALSAEALQRNNTSFLELARTQLERFQSAARDDLEQRQKSVEHLVAPLKETLEKVDGHTRILEQARKEAYGTLAQQVRSLAEGQEKLRRETGNLVTALRAPHVRGRWGEMQLKRVVEMAGMVPYCDFVEQTTTRDADGRALRPDVVVRLAGGKNIVVDAKAPLHAYLDALETQDDDVRRVKLAEHARQVRDHITKLGSKSYWRQFANTPDFVVMCLPDETVLRAAMEHDPALIEAGVEAGVVPATPTTLIGLLRVISYGWQQETVAESAREVSELGRELYERLSVLGRHVAKLGRSLDGAVAAYNETVGSLENRVLVTARRFEAHGITGELPPVEPLERQSRPLQAVELTLPFELAPPSDADAA
jgi:DNA recombination protein RmuC